MSELYPLSDEAKVDILRKLVLFWDGQWFLKTVDEFGLEAAVRLNARVRAAFGRIEMRTLLRALGKRQQVLQFCRHGHQSPLQRR